MSVCDHCPQWAQYYIHFTGFLTALRHLAQSVRLSSVWLLPELLRRFFLGRKEMHPLKWMDILMMVQYDLINSNYRLLPSLYFLIFVTVNHFATPTSGKQIKPGIQPLIPFWWSALNRAYGLAEFRWHKTLFESSSFPLQYIYCCKFRINHFLLLLPLHCRTFPIRGFQIYDGPVRLTQSTFRRFVQTPERYTSAVGFNLKNTWQLTPRNNLSQLSFHSTVRTHLVFCDCIWIYMSF